MILRRKSLGGWHTGFALLPVPVSDTEQVWLDWYQWRVVDGYVVTRVPGQSREHRWMTYENFRAAGDPS